MIILKNIFVKLLTCLIVIFVGLIVFCNITGCKDENIDNLDKVRVGEVTHSAFYAPLYVAIEKGYFKDEGIDVDLSLISGANNVTAAVLSGDVEIGFCGPEATIYIYNGGEKDYIRTFAGLTKRDGQFLVSRKEIKDFTWDMLKGKEVLAGRVGGMPELNFKNAIKNAELKTTDVNINTSVDFASLTSAFIGGECDFVNLFEPNATKLVNMGYGYVVASIGEKSGEMPYTAFNARKSYIENNKDLLTRFTRAIDKGIKFCQERTPDEIASAIIGQFPDTSINDLVTIIKRYKDADSWLDDPYIEESMFKNLEDIMIDSKQIKEYVPYNDLVNNLHEK